MHQHCGAGAVNEPRQHIAAEAVRSQQVARIGACRPGRRRQDREQILLVGIMRGEKAGKDRAAGDAEDHAERNQGPWANAANGRGGRASAQPQFRV